MIGADQGWLDMVWPRSGRVKDGWVLMRWGKNRRGLLVVIWFGLARVSYDLRRVRVV